MKSKIENVIIYVGGMMMINKDLISFDINAKNKNDALKKMSEILYCNKRVSSKEEIFKDILERESLSTTGFGNHVAIPHAQSSVVLESSVVFVRFDEEVEWQSLDDKRVKVAMMIVVNTDNKDNEHLRILSKLAEKLIDEEFIEFLIRCDDKEKIEKIIRGE